jgi:hypothetical protein
MFEAMFAQLADLRLALVQKLLYEPGGNGLAIATRAMRLSREEFATMYLLTRRARPGGGQVSGQSGARGAAGSAVDLGRALGFYDKVGVDTAQKVLERWRRDPNYLFAIKTIELGQGGAPDGPAE